MTRRILTKRQSANPEKKSRSRMLGATWMQGLVKTLTDDEREALARALASLLERSDVAASGQEGLAR
jgi:hypothetical protein